MLYYMILNIIWYYILLFITLYYIILYIVLYYVYMMYIMYYIYTYFVCNNYTTLYASTIINSYTSATQNEFHGPDWMMLLGLPPWTETSTKTYYHHIMG